MSDPKDVFKRELEDAVRKLAPDLKVEVHVERPKNPEHGDGSLLEFGEAVFREQCASCHEEDARGDDDGFVPSLRNQHYSYLLKQTRALAENHRRNVDPNLVLFMANLKSDELTGLADYLSRLSGPVKDRLKMRDNGVVGD